MLTIESLSKTYRGPAGEIRALREFSLTVAAGEFVAVQGASGCGKSTLLLAAGGLLAPDRGSVLLDGRDLYALAPDARARFRASAIGFVFQQFHLVPYLSVLDNVLVPSIAAAVPNARSRAEEILTRFGLEPRLAHVPGQLSTGERQRTAMARALLAQPKLLLADEPTGNLDRENASVILEILKDHARQGGAVLLVTHDDGAAGYADRQIGLDKTSVVGGSAA